MSYEVKHVIGNEFHVRNNHMNGLEYKVCADEAAAELLEQLSTTGTEMIAPALCLLAEFIHPYPYNGAKALDQWQAAGVAGMLQAMGSYLDKLNTEARENIAVMQEFIRAGKAARGE